MDLSKPQKTRRDAVEEPLFLTEELLDDLQEMRTRIDAAIKVWPETRSTLEPVLYKLEKRTTKRISNLHEKLSALWKRGAAKLWKEL